MTRISDTASTPKSEHVVSWDGLDLVSTSENISGGIEWAINDKRHAVIVHLGGPMTALETELDGRGMSFAPANAGEIWIVPANSRYASRADGGDIEYAVLFLESTIIDRLVEDNIPFDSIVPLHGVRDDFCFYAVRELLSSSKSDDDVSEMLSESTQRALVLHLYQKYGDGAAEERNLRRSRFNDQTVTYLRAYIYEHLGEKVTLATLSNKVGMRTNPFLVAFRRAFGQTPAQYLIAQRIRRVQWLLANSSNDITSIALETGFSSHSHLSTVFRRRMDETPSDFRIRWRERKSLRSNA